MTLCVVCVRYQNRYWRESVFQGVECVKKALDESYGVGGDSLVSAAFRWLSHHSLLDPQCGGWGAADTILCMCEWSGQFSMQTVSSLEVADWIT